MYFIFTMQCADREGAFTNNEIQPDFVLKIIGSNIQPIVGDEPILSAQ